MRHFNIDSGDSEVGSRGQYRIGASLAVAYLRSLRAIEFWRAFFREGLVAFVKIRCLHALRLRSRFQVERALKIQCGFAFQQFFSHADRSERATLKATRTFHGFFHQSRGGDHSIGQADAVGFLSVDGTNAANSVWCGEVEVSLEL